MERARPRRIADRFALGHHRVQKGYPVRRNLAAFDSGLNRTAGLAVVPAIPEAALAEERSDVDERLLDRMRGEMREAECLDTGRIDYPAISAEDRDLIQGRRRGRVTAGRKGR